VTDALTTRSSNVESEVDPHALLSGRLGEQRVAGAGEGQDERGGGIERIAPDVIIESSGHERGGIITGRRCNGLDAERVTEEGLRESKGETRIEPGIVALHGDAGVDLRVKDQLRPMSDIGAAVVDALQRSLGIDEQSHAVSGGFAVGQAERSHHFLDKGGIADGRIQQIPGPFLQIGHRRVDPAGTHGATQVTDRTPVAVLSGSVTL